MANFVKDALRPSQQKCRGRCWRGAPMAVAWARGTACSRRWSPHQSCAAGCRRHGSAVRRHGTLPPLFSTFLAQAQAQQHGTAVRQLNRDSATATGRGAGGAGRVAGVHSPQHKVALQPGDGGGGEAVPGRPRVEDGRRGRVPRRVRGALPSSASYTLRSMYS
jgi:hypothetical protein